MNGKRGWYKLALPAIVLVEQSLKATKAFSLVLPMGSTVYVNPIDERVTSPLGVTEFHVQFRDSGGVHYEGWLAANTPMTAAGGPLTFGDGDRDPITEWDDLREKLFGRHWTVKHFCSRLKTSEVPFVRAVIRELGGATPKGDKDMLAQVLTRITHVQEVQMSQDTAETGTATAKSVKKNKKSKKVKGTKAVKAKSNGEGRSAARSAGQVILDTGTGNGKIKAVAQRLVKGDTLSSKQLIELRDQINEAAVKAREDGKDNIAAKLSNANRLVRRLARAAS